MCFNIYLPGPARRSEPIRGAAEPSRAQPSWPFSKGAAVSPCRWTAMAPPAAPLMLPRLNSSKLEDFMKFMTDIEEEMSSHYEASAQRGDDEALDSVRQVQVLLADRV